jgi:peptidoglycan/xylan/chitin deacetylase (PgdA/CDA1 family)
MSGGTGLGIFASAAVQGLASLLSGRAGNRSLLILIFHRVLAVPDPMMPGEPDVVRFSSQLDLLARHFTVLPLREAVGRMGAGTLPSRSVCITFDDGYANNCELALPLLRQRGLPATVFVASGYLNGGAMFNDVVLESLRVAPAEIDLSEADLGRYQLGDINSRRDIAGELILKLKYRPPQERARRASALARACGLPNPPNLMMSDEQVRHLHDNGIEIGAHTVMHPMLTAVSDADVRQELAANREYLERLVGAPIRSFAYPNGAPSRDYDSRHPQLVREAGFDIALTTAWGAAQAGCDPLQLPRIAPWDRTPFRYAVRMARGYMSRTPACV